MSIQLLFNKRKYTLTFPEAERESESAALWAKHVSLLDLEKKVEDITGVPRKKFKLIHAGGKL